MRAPFFVAVAAIFVGWALPTKIEAYLFYKADRYDLHGKDILRSNPKEYIVDLGIRSYLGIVAASATPVSYLFKTGLATGRAEGLAFKQGGERHLAA